MAGPSKPTEVDKNDPDYDPAASYFELTPTADVTRLGMRYVKTEIVAVVEGGWAAENGVEIDDEIWAV